MTSLSANCRSQYAALFSSNSPMWRLSAVCYSTSRTLQIRTETEGMGGWHSLSISLPLSLSQTLREGELGHVTSSSDHLSSQHHTAPTHSIVNWIMLHYWRCVWGKVRVDRQLRAPRLQVFDSAARDPQAVVQVDALESSTLPEGGCYWLGW